MSKTEQLLAVVTTEPFILTFVVTTLATGVFAKINKMPPNWKTGAITGMAFFMGAVATILSQ
jgi:hypothetical protein